MDLTISIPTWNSKAYLKRCLESIYQSVNGLACEVVVVDNASSDGTAEMVRQDFPQVTLIVNPENRGYGRANNQVIRRAAGRYVLVLNEDTVILEGTLERMVGYLDTHLTVGALGCKIYTSLAHNAIQPSAFYKFPTPENYLLNRLASWWVGQAPRSPVARRFQRWVLPYAEDHEVAQEPRHIVGAIMLLRKASVEDAGLFDERFFLFYEETDLCHRLRKAGWRIAYIPDAAIVHFYDRNRPRRSGYDPRYDESFTRYLLKHHTLVSVLVWKTLYGFSVAKARLVMHGKNRLIVGN